MEYMLIQRETALDLQRFVRSLLAEGWRPLGGVAVGSPEQPGGAGGEYVQALVRELQPAGGFAQVPMNLAYQAGDPNVRMTCLACGSSLRFISIGG